MLIGELSRTCNCPVETIRYYEKIGLLPAARRRPNGYRAYDDAHAVLLRFIVRTKRLGFTQDQVRQLTKLARRKKPPCADVFALLDMQYQEVRDRIAELRKIERALLRLKRRCRDDAQSDCPVLDELMR